jgi:hypothetical protein
MVSYSDIIATAGLHFCIFGKKRGEMVDGGWWMADDGWWKADGGC